MASTQNSFDAPNGLVRYSKPPYVENSQMERRKIKKKKTTRELLVPRELYFDRNYYCPGASVRKFRAMVRSQPISLWGLIKEKVKVISQPSSHRHIIKDIKPMHIELVPAETQAALEKKLEKMARHEQNRLILKKFLKVIQDREGGNEGEFLVTSIPSMDDAGRVEERVKKMATKLAMVTLRKEMLIGNEKIQKSFFKSVAMFILRTFDMEDLERFNCSDKLEVEYTKFYCENLSRRKSDENPHKLVAEGKIKFDGFPLLREQDVGNIIWRYIVGSRMDSAGIKFSHGVRLMNFSFGAYEKCCFEEKDHSHFVEMARSILLQYIPMKKDEAEKIHSSFEFIGCTCRCPLDAFCSEASEIRAVKTLLSDLTNGRRHTLESMSFAVTYVLKRGPFGSFAKEVFDLVNIANVRRRFQGHRFISKHHILWALDLTRIKDFSNKLVEGIGLRNYSVEEPATCPPYNVYMSARTMADIHSVVVVGLEHMALATIFEMSQGKLRENQNKFNYTERVKKFLDDVLQLLKEM